MALAEQIALVPEGVNIGASELTRVASALSKQVNRDFRPIWGIDATVDAFATLEDVPIDYWPVTIVPDVQGAAGFHLDRDGQPFAVVEHGPDWSLTASHEVLEMLADPFGNRLKAANLLDQAVELGLKPARVRYLIEVCDPSEAGRFAYRVNNVLVSDFYTPEYFDPVKASGVRYSFTGVLDGPRRVLENGYISWQDRTSGDWLQLRMFPDNLSTKVPHVVNLSNLKVFSRLLGSVSVREAMDRVTIPPPHRDTVALTAAARVAPEVSDEAQVARAKQLRADIAAVGGGRSAAPPKPLAQRARTKQKARKPR